MIQLKELLNMYKEGCETHEQYRTRVTPLMETLSYLATAQEMLNNALSVSMSLPDRYGIKELRAKIDTVLAWLDNYKDENITEVIGK